MKLLVALILCSLLTLTARGQTVTIKNIELAGQKVIVHYDLEDSNPNNEYSLGLYASRDNFSTALLRVTGDIGTEITPGTDKKVIWNVAEELGNYKGRLSLELRGKVFTPIVKLQQFDIDKKYKRGKSYPLKWKPGNSNPVNIELFKGGQRISGEVNHPNSGSSLLSIPSDAAKGDDYRLKITDTKNPDGIIYSGTFSVVPKIPMLLKVLVPVALVGGAAAALSGGSGGNENPQQNATEIPLPGLPGN